ncbi:mutT-family protein [Streptomyces laurentii]|uniref:MutT-family protein n=1 Tax=Streptomyces laurentii TaxID=39478 RepID=A0A169PNC9_STRLU|nr:mutT-family protein [Streptomyces laurentii]
MGSATSRWLSGFCRLTAQQNPREAATAIAKDHDAPAIVHDASLAYLIHVQTKNGGRLRDRRWEWVIHAFGEQGPELAERLAATVRA